MFRRHFRVVHSGHISERKRAVDGRTLTDLGHRVNESSAEHSLGLIEDLREVLIPSLVSLPVPLIEFSEEPLSLINSHLLPLDVLEHVS